VRSGRRCKQFECDNQEIISSRVKWHGFMSAIKSYSVCKQINGDRIISLFGFSRYIDFALHLDMIYI